MCCAGLGCICPLCPSCVHPSRPPTHPRVQVRIEQVLMSSPPPLLCFRLSQLLAFYLSTVERLLGGASQLAEALRGSRAMALRSFQEGLRQRGAKLLRYPPPPPRDLAPPQQVRSGRWGGACTVRGLVRS